MVKGKPKDGGLAPSEGSGEALFRPLTKVCELVVLDIERLGACGQTRFPERFRVRDSQGE